MTLNLAEFVKVMAGENSTVTVDGQYMSAALRRAELLERLAVVCLGEEKAITGLFPSQDEWDRYQEFIKQRKEILAELSKEV